MKLIKIGKVLKAHGFRGSFTVSSTEGKDSALKNARTVFIGKDESCAIPYPLTETAWMPKAWKVTSENIKSDKEVELLKNLSVFIEKEKLPETKTGEYYVHDLLSLEGIDEKTGLSIGKFKDLEEIGIPNSKIKQQSWIFEKNGIETQVPAVKQYLVRVDLKEKKIFLKNLKDLLDE